MQIRSHHLTSDARFGGTCVASGVLQVTEYSHRTRVNLEQKIKSHFKRHSHRRRAVTNGFTKLWAFAVTEASLDSSGPARHRARCPFLWDWEGAGDTDTSPDASRLTVRVWKCGMREFRSDPDHVPGNGASFCLLQGVSTNATLTASLPGASAPFGPPSPQPVCVFHLFHMRVSTMHCLPELIITLISPLTVCVVFLACVCM